MTIICGIDPGLSGAAAFIKGGAVTFADLPTKEKAIGGMVAREIDARALCQLLRTELPATESAIVVLEQVGMLGGAKAMQYAASLIDSVAVIRAVCEICRFRLEFVLPSTWQKFYGLGRSLPKDPALKPGQQKAAAKAASRAKAIQLYPQAAALLARVKDDNRAEALLMAHWGLRKFVEPISVRAVAELVDTVPF